MKKPTCLIFSLLLITVYACTIRHDCCDVAQRPAEIIGQKNGAAWSPMYVTGSMNEINIFTLTAVSFSPINTTVPANKIDSLNLKILYTGTGTYKLSSSQVFYATYAGGASTVYSLDDTYNNVLNITSFQQLNDPYTTNPDEVEVKGTFDVKFIDPNNAAGISISGNSFYAIMHR